MDTQDFDLLISKYSDDLMQMKEKWSKWGIVTEEKPKESEAKEAEDENEEMLPDETPDADTTEEEADEYPAEEMPLPDEEFSPADEDTVSEYPKANPESYATFTARVFSGDEAYPIKGAKISIYREGKLHTFLITNENGETATVKIESAPAENALIPNSDNQELDYMADVYAEGFTPKKGLLVSAVGDSSILLTVQLTPLSERID